MSVLVEGTGAGNRRARAARTRRNLLVAAAEVFEREGFSGANLHAVCDRAKVTKGALYCHFRSKDALAVALVEHQALESYALRDELLRRGLGPAQTLIDLSFAFVRRLEEDLMTRIGNRLLREATIFDRAGAGQVIGWTTIVRDLLKSADRAGELRPGLNLRQVAEGMVGEFLGLQLISQALTGQRDLHARLRRAWRAQLPSLVQPNALRGLRIAPAR
ncbi:ScbR family autoregulator-binding transcription factor [Amycolatopsis aidingensis]|uniref:ScbR family autoregulator-binding transcription factor n=1 Tax=Amycolatopsis aidingensis TaxID=2842453 RepID=UPI001C0B14A7|nr:ScbR family autoregulator-binding transcription factor [Amycolatopsis aidingensis]